MRVKELDTYLKGTVAEHTKYRIILEEGDSLESVANELCLSAVALASHNGRTVDDYSPRPGQSLMYLGHDLVMPIGLALREVADQVLVTPAKDWRPSGPTWEEYQEYLRKK